MALDKKVKAVNGEPQRILHLIGPMRFIRRPCIVAMAFLGVCIALINLPGKTHAASDTALRAVAGGERLGAIGQRPRASGADQRAAEAPMGPEQAIKPTPNVGLRAALAPGASPLSEGISWRISKLDKSQSKELIWSGAGAEPKVYLKPGRYYVEATYGLAGNGQTLEVKPENAVDVLFNLNAGTLHVNAAAIAGGPPLDNMFFTLRTADADIADGGEIGRSTLPQAVFHVPAGAYRLTARHGIASIDIPVRVSPGAESRVEAVMNSGTVALSAHALDSGPLLSGATFMVIKNGEPGGRQEVVRSRLDEPKFDLPAGQYRVAAVLGLARVEKDITVGPGEAQKHNLVLDAGGVRLASALAGNGTPLDRNLLYRVYGQSPKDGAPNQELIATTAATPTLFLPSGRYRIESQYGWHNARQAREIEVSAGDVLDVSFEHKACEVKLKLVQKPGAGAIEPVKWTLKYNGGGTVLISQDAAPTLILQAGNYQAMAQHEAKTYSQTFEAASNQEQTIEIIAQ